MPITIKQATLKFRDPDTGNYTGVDVVAETTTSEQIATVLASIPSDYTTLSNDVSALQSAVTFATVAETKTFLGIT